MLGANLGSLLNGDVSVITVFLPNSMPPKHAEQDQIDAKSLGKS